MIRMRAPEGTAFFKHQGHDIPIDEYGVVMIDERHESDLLSHGFTAAGPAPNRTTSPLPDPSGDYDPRRGEAIRFLAGLSTEQLEMLAKAASGRLSVVTADMAPLPQHPLPPVPDPVLEPEIVDAPPISSEGKLTEAQISAMTKPQMLTWCRERQIPCIPPITNEELRQKVRHANDAA